MNKKRNIYAPRVVVADPQGDVIHIKNKATGRVILRLKLRPDRQYSGDYEMLLDMCDNRAETGAVAYTFGQGTDNDIDRYEGGKP